MEGDIGMEGDGGSLGETFSGHERSQSVVLMSS